MIHVLGRLAVADVERFLAVFSTAGAEARQRHRNPAARSLRARTMPAGSSFH